VNETYTSLFNSQAGKDAYISLILATELYAQRFTNSDWLLGYETEDGEKVEGFNDKMNKIAEALKTMSAEDLTLFNADFGTIYADYRKIFDAYNPTDDGEGGEGTDTEIDLGEWKDEFNALKSVVGHLEAAYTAVNQGVNIYNVFFSTFERAQKLYNHILNNAPENIKYILIHEGLYEATITNEDSSTETIFWSYDYVMSVYRAMYVNALVSLGSYDIYKEYEMAALMDMTYELYWINDMSKTIDAMEYFCNMDIEAQIIFILYFNMDESFSYYAAIESSLKDAGYSENVQNAVIKLLDVEMSAIIYNFYTSIIADSDEEMTDEVEAELAVALDELNTAYAAFTDAYGALTTEELAEFEDFDYVYNFYKTLVEKVNSDNTVNP